MCSVRWPTGQGGRLSARFRSLQRNLRGTVLPHPSRPQFLQQLEHLPEHQPVHRAYGHAVYTDLLTATQFPKVFSQSKVFSQLWLAEVTLVADRGAKTVTQPDQGGEASTASQVGPDQPARTVLSERKVCHGRRKHHVIAAARRQRATTAPPAAHLPRVPPRRPT